MNKRTAKCEIKFKEAVKALPINIEMLTKGKLNARTHNNGANGRC